MVAFKVFKGVESQGRRGAEAAQRIQSEPGT